MNGLITYGNLSSFAYSNERLIRGEIRGAVLNFFGLGGMTMYPNDPTEGLEFAEQNLLYVVPYYNPWSWMNRQAVRYTDEVLAVLLAQCGLDPHTVRIASTGGSMGGLAALVYCAYAAITPTACFTNCPVCDLSFHYSERPDLPRTLYSAFGDYDCDLETALRSCSPLHLTDRLPRIPYTVYHCRNDKAVGFERHAVPFVAAMQEAGHRISLTEVPLRGHCDLPPAYALSYREAILDVFA